MDPTVHVTDITKTYGTGAREVSALRGVTFKIRPGELVAVVGPSGSGKTTLLAIMGGLLTPTSGSVVVDGRDIWKLTRRELARYRGRSVGFVFQSGNLLPYLTALENVSMMAAFSKTKGVDERARRLIDALGLTDRASALATELSGGERQRVAIARALVNDPSLLLVDEPTANLDSRRGEQVVRLLLGEVHTRQVAGVMVTHDLSMARLADRTIELSDGQLRAYSAA